MTAKTGVRAWMTKPRLLIAAAVFVVGSLIGVGLFTFVYARGISYLGNDPASCVNCHVMERMNRGRKAATTPWPPATTVTHPTTISSTSTSSRLTTGSGTG